MSSKQIALEVSDKLPEEASLIEIAHELEFVAGIHEGAAELDQACHLTAGQMRERIPSWASNSR